MSEQMPSPLPIDREPSRTNASRPEKPMGAVVREIGHSLNEVIRSEIQLAHAEFKESADQVGRHTLQFAGFGMIAMLGVLPLMGGLVLKVGEALGGDYQLSALLVGGGMVLGGGIPAVFAYRKIRSQDISFPETRDAIWEGIQLVDRKARDVAVAARRRMS